MEEAPDAERTCVGVTAREKMSVMCALGGQLGGSWWGSSVFTIIDRMCCEVLFRLRWLAFVIQWQGFKYHCHRYIANVVEGVVVYWARCC